MTPRPRKTKNKGLPENLYSAKVSGRIYYRYKHPVSRKIFGFGTNKAKAISDAKQLNSMLVIVGDRVAAIMADVTLSQHIKWYKLEIMPKRELAESTKSIYRTRFKNLEESLGSHTIESISVKDIAKLIEGLGVRSGQQLRDVAKELFKTAAGRGLIETNPAELANKPVYKKTRQRLTQEQYNAVYDVAPQWFKNIMKVALVTLQRRCDLVKMRFDNVKDGYLFVIQEKTKKYDTGYLKIKVGPELESIITECRDDIVSPYIVHMRPKRKIKRESCDHWTQVTKDTVTRTFKDLSENLAEFKTIPAAERPTFHEIRALGIKIYKDAKHDPKELAGHASEQQTKNYDSGHNEIRWIETQAR